MSFAPPPFLCILDIPVLQAGRLPPCHGCFPHITVSYFYKKFNLNHALFISTLLLKKKKTTEFIAVVAVVW